MKWSTVRSGARATVLSATLALAGAGAAHAIIYTGNWDPLFGPTLPNLSFSGTASLYVPDACVTRTEVSFSGLVSNFSSCTDTGNEVFDPMRLVSASVTLTDVRDNTSETIDFLTGVPTTALADLVNGVYIEFSETNELDGTLIGASTGYIGPQRGTIDASMSGGLANDFWLRFGPEMLIEGFAARQIPFAAEDYRQAYLVAAVADSGVDNGTLSNPARVTYAAVPEPGSLALVFGAFGAAAFALRRRRQ